MILFILNADHFGNPDILTDFSITGKFCCRFVYKSNNSCDNVFERKLQNRTYRLNLFLNIKRKINYIIFKSDFYVTYCIREQERPDLNTQFRLMYLKYTFNT